MSDENIGTGTFSEVAKEKAKEAAESEEARGFAKRLAGKALGFSDFDSTKAEYAKKATLRLFKGSGGMSVDDIRGEYDCSERTAYVVRGVTRIVGVDEVPPVADIAYGVAKGESGGPGNGSGD